MRVVLALLLAACVIPAALAQTCPTEPNNAYDTTTCSGYVACETALCACSNTTSRVAGCSASLNSNTACNVLTPCVQTYFQCLDALVAARNNTADTCQSFGTRLYTAMLQAALGSYLGSSLQKMCSAHTCTLFAGANRTAGSARACSLGANESEVCKMPLQLTTAPATTIAPIRVQLTLTGNDFYKLFGASTPPAKGTVYDSSNPQFAKVAGLIVTDLARMLNVLAALLRILSFTYSSLIVAFEVDASAGLSVAQTQTLIQQAASNSSWLQTFAAEYSKVSNETIGFGGVSVSQPGAPTTASPPTTAAPPTTVAATTTRAPVASAASPLAIAASVVVAVLAVAFSA